MSEECSRGELGVKDEIILEQQDTSDDYVEEEERLSTSQVEYYDYPQTKDLSLRDYDITMECRSAESRKIITKQEAYNNILNQDITESVIWTINKEDYRIEILKQYSYLRRPMKLKVIIKWNELIQIGVGDEYFLVDKNVIALNMKYKKWVNGKTQKVELNYKKLKQQNVQFEETILGHIQLKQTIDRDQVVKRICNKQQQELGQEDCNLKQQIKQHNNMDQMKNNTNRIKNKQGRKEVERDSSDDKNEQENENTNNNINKNNNNNNNNNNNKNNNNNNNNNNNKTVNKINNKNDNEN